MKLHYTSCIIPAALYQLLYKRNKQVRYVLYFRELILSSGELFIQEDRVEKWSRRVRIMGEKSTLYRDGICNYEILN